MKYLHLIRAALFRRKGRTFLTLISIMAAFLLFGMLNGVRQSFADAGKSAVGATRLQTTSRLSFIQPLPMSLAARIEQVDGVEEVTWANWFGGAYQEPSNQIFTFAVPPNYLDIYTEANVDQAARERFAATRTGLLVGKTLAERYQWKVGEQIPLLSNIFPNADGSKVWTFDIVGIMDTDDSFMSQTALLHWKYFDESNPYNQGQVGWYVSRIGDVEAADRIARDIDTISANSSHETKTQTEAAVTANWIKQTADITLITSSIMGAVFFTLLLLTGNTMAQAVRERTAELAVLKTIGFRDVPVLMMVLAESVSLILIGGVIGLGIVAVLGPVVDAMSGGIVNLPPVGWSSWALGIAIMVLIGLVVGAPPALRAMRLNVVDALAGR
ncbi:MAG TPA: ABC transporter permease [Woeseiaceae bacterium]